MLTSFFWPFPLAISGQKKCGQNSPGFSVDAESSCCSVVTDKKNKKNLTYRVLAINKRAIPTEKRVYIKHFVSLE